jgi:hypothetical protein
MEHPWTPLDDAGENIRLTEILGTADGSISCRLHTARLIDKDDQPDQPRFAALSYVWGDASDTEDITVDGKPWAVTADLAAALRCVKSHWQLEFPERDPSSFRLWADALCINQQDPVEQGRQVMRMRFIYPLAEVVFAWLGGHDDVVSAVLELIDGIKAAYEDAGDEAGFRTLEWLQGLARGSSRSSSCRAVCCTARRRAACRERICSRWPRRWSICIVSSSTRSWPRPRFVSGLCWAVVADTGIRWNAVTAIDNVNGELAPDRNVRLERTLHDAASIASALLVASIGGRFVATDPKDYVYALLSLACLDIIPDYRQEKWYIDVYCDFISRCLGIYPAGIDISELWFWISRAVEMIAGRCRHGCPAMQT